MLFSILFQNPEVGIIIILAIIYGITVHEFAHAWAASVQGDNTAKLAGRLTLNPLPHIDLMGFLILMFAGFGWGKPVPVNPLNLKNGKKSDTIVSLAGIIFNIISAIIFIIVLKLIVIYSNLGSNNFLILFLFYLIHFNIILAVFNILPIPPLDGSHVLFNVLPDKYNEFKANFARNGPFVLLMLILADNFLGIGIFSSLFNFFFSLIESLITRI